MLSPNPSGRSQATKLGSLPPAEWWEQRTRVEGDCLLWIRAKDADGYGNGSWGGRNWRVHRLAYAQFVGQLAAGLTIDHLCRVRACVNPEHLEQVANRTNLLRGEGFVAVQARKTHCPRGHPYDNENTYVAPGRYGRKCRICTKEQNRSWYASYYAARRGERS